MGRVDDEEAVRKHPTNIAFIWGIDPERYLFQLLQLLFHLSIHHLHVKHSNLAETGKQKEPNCRNKGKEVEVVSAPDTSINPRTMMVKPLDTYPTHVAVSTAGNLYDPTVRAQV